MNIDRIMEAKGIETLHKRRCDAVLRFALKNEEKERYGKRWFTKPQAALRPRREHNELKYVVPFCRTERMRANPIVHMTQLLNEHYSQ